jgi:hypothetical protein
VDSALLGRPYYFFKECTISSGTDVMIFKIFSAKKSAKKLAFLAQNKGKLCKILIITLVLEKNAIFCRKLAKIAENNIDPQDREIQRLRCKNATSSLVCFENQNIFY